MVELLLGFLGGTFFGLYVGNLKFRTKVNEGVSKVINKSKERDNQAKKKGKK